jgi:WD40 repeat protein
MLRVSDTADDENRKTRWPIPVAGPMRHDGEVLSAQFSADGQRVVTASRDKTARVWDAPDDVLLLADLAEAACGSVLQASGQTEILKTPASRSGESHPAENRCKVWATIFGINAGRAIAKKSESYSKAD